MIDQSLLATKDCRHGRFTYLRGDTYIGRSLSLYGEWCEGEIVLFKRLIGQGAIAIDVGANIGTHTLALAKIVGPSGMVHSFEPQEELCELLRANVEANDLENVTVYCSAAGARKGVAKMPRIDYSGANNFGALQVGHGEREVTVTAIDDLELTKVDLIKVDVEGAEAEVIGGARNTLKRARPILYVENNQPDKAAGLVDLIRGMGYRLWWHFSAYYIEANFAGNPHNVWPGLFDPYVVCLPQEMPPPAWPLAEL